jgi:hypothetical protein
MRAGLNADGLSLTANAYTAGLSEGAFDPENAKGTYGGIGTGLVRDLVRSKIGVYRGASKGKIHYLGMALNPELLAASDINPMDDFNGWQRRRMAHDRGYEPIDNTWMGGPVQEQFLKSVGLDVGLFVGQKLAERIGINRLLPKGINL